MAERDPNANSGNRFCGNCGSAVVPGTTTCVHCHTAIEPEPTVIELDGDYIPYCRACGIPVAREEALHCTKCGVTPLCQKHFYPSTLSCSLCPPVESPEQETETVSAPAAGPWPEPTVSIPCPQCGARIRRSVDYCPNCGAEQEGAAESSQYAGFLIRLFAFIIDNLITGLPVTLIAVFNDIPSFGTVVSIIYYVLFTYYKGQTPGKMLLRLHVEDKGGNKPNLKQVLLRETIGKAISTLVMLIGFLWIFWDPKKRGWHDHIGGTYVIKRNQK